MFLEDLKDSDLAALPYLFEFWALPHQRPPLGDWRTWVILGGRGAGKTRAGAEWVRSLAEGPKRGVRGIGRRIALVGETMEQAREVMVFGESGILAVSPPDMRPQWHATRRLLEWANGATAQVLSAHDPDALRGRQFDFLWADELAKWKSGKESWDMLQFALRLGEDPRACVTTTPRNVEFLKELLLRPSTAMSHAATSANRANLATGFLEEITAKYAGSRMGDQEMEGLLLADAEGALWTSEQLAGLTCTVPPVFDRIVVSVDPPVSHHAKSDACGIVVAGVVLRGPVQEWRAVVLEDVTVKSATPLGWAQAAVDALYRHGAHCLLAEVNQGGAMVEAMLRQVDEGIPFKAVHATKGKLARAEPIASLYEQGRVTHMRGLRELEAQMCLMTRHGYEGSGSPDRVDALVWALQDLLQKPISGWRSPRMRQLG